MMSKTVLTKSTSRTLSTGSATPAPSVVKHTGQQSQNHRCHAEFISASHTCYCSSAVENFDIIFSPSKRKELT